MDESELLGKSVTDLIIMLYCEKKNKFSNLRKLLTSLTLKHQTEDISTSHGFQER